MEYKIIFKKTVNGQELSVSEMVDIYEFYRASCTADRIINSEDEFTLNGEKIEDEQTALDLAYEAIDIMDDYHINECDAIKESIARRECQS